MRPSWWARTGLLLLAAALFVSFFAWDAGTELSLDSFRERQAGLQSLVDRRPWPSAAAFFLLYVAVAAASIPGAALLTLVGGALFGLGWGTLIVSFASSAGATLAFLASRYLFRDLIASRFGARLEAVDDGVRREGAFYLFALRLVPAVPFFLINLLSGLTAMRTWTFYWVSQAGMLPGTLVYVNAGTQIARIESLSGLLSPALLGSFALLGVFPLAARKTLEAARRRRVSAGWRRPPRFDRNLVVIGAGAAGLVCAYIAAAARARVTLIERERMGGDCLNTGCVPSKALIRSARLLYEARRAAERGLDVAVGPVDFAAVMRHVRRTVDEVAPHDSAERYRRLGVECLEGEATVTSPWSVSVRGRDGAERSLTAAAIVIAAGARPIVPPLPGLDRAACLTSDTVWDLEDLPARLVVLGGGAVGCELAQCFARFGARVTVVELGPRLLAREDADVSDIVSAQFRLEGIDVRTAHEALRVEGGSLVCRHAGDEVLLPFDRILCAVGRAPATAGFGLEALGIPVTRTGTLEVDACMRTLHPSIYACGDVAGPYQLTHAAAHTAWYATVNALFGGLRRFRADFSAMPAATFTDPEVATVGLNERAAAERGVAFEATRYALADLDRAIVDGRRDGWVKVLTVPGRDTVLGATIVGEHAGDLIVEFTLAMKHGLGLGKLLGTLHAYPTLSEAARQAAGQWRREHAPQGLLAWAERYHRWRRGAWRAP